MGVLSVNRTRVGESTSERGRSSEDLTIVTILEFGIDLVLEQQVAGGYGVKHTLAASTVVARRRRNIDEN